MPIICSSQNKYQLETMHLDMLQKKQVAGFLLSSIHLDSAFLKTLHGIPMPFVLFDQPYGYEKTDSVTFDFFEAGYMATRFLFDAGHKDIVFASGPLDRHSRKQLFEGYKKALKEKHIRFSSQNLVMASSAEICDGNCEDGFHCGQCIGDLLMSREYLPDAVFAVNDMVAIGIIKALEKQGIRIPADVSVIGCDNIPFGEMLVPALTTVNQSAVETGQLATDILLGRIENKQVDNNHIILHPKLIERETVRKIKYKVRR
jgi:LacI family transcriptional regulator